MKMAFPQIAKVAEDENSVIMKKKLNGVERYTATVYRKGWLDVDQAERKGFAVAYLSADTIEDITRKVNVVVNEVIPSFTGDGDIDMSLPPLAGSEKQIAWAEDLRQKFIAELKESGFGLKESASDKLKAAVDAVLQEKSAEVWIDRRNTVMTAVSVILSKYEF